MPSPTTVFSHSLVLLLSIPLALLALITTALAFGTLILRAGFVYLELAYALFQTSLTAALTTSFNLPTQKEISATTNLNQASMQAYIGRRRKQQTNRNRSAVFKPSSPLPPQSSIRNNSSVSLVGASSASRDYEGVGGWRLTTNGQEDALWMDLNSRLELPSGNTERTRRHHHRSLSSQSQRLGKKDATLRMSPVQSRRGTPPAIQSSMPAFGDPQSSDRPGYFDFAPNDFGPMSPEELAAKERMDKRRLSIGSASASSAASNVSDEYVP